MKDELNEITSKSRKNFILLLIYSFYFLVSSIAFWVQIIGYANNIQELFAFWKIFILLISFGFVYWSGGNFLWMCFGVETLKVKDETYLIYTRKVFFFERVKKFNLDKMGIPYLEDSCNLRNNSSIMRITETLKNSRSMLLSGFKGKLIFKYKFDVIRVMENVNREILESVIEDINYSRRTQEINFK